MSNLIKMLLNGITSTTSVESEGKEIKMVNFTTNSPILDLENQKLFQASIILENLGNHDGVSAQEFYDAMMLNEDIHIDDHDALTLAAISIETMMRLDDHFEEHLEPTIH